MTSKSAKEGSGLVPRSACITRWTGMSRQGFEPWTLGFKSPKPHSSTGRYRGFQWLSVAKSDNALRSSGQQLDLKRYQNTITASLHNPSKPCEIKVDTTA